MLLTDGLELFHGSYIKVMDPNLEECKPRKDFGRGFYVTTSHQQAVRFSKISVSKAKNNGIIPREQDLGYVSRFIYKADSNLSVYEFEDADREWLHCVVTHRRTGGFADQLNRWKDYDVICGKIANDNTNLVITAYMDGLYGEVFSEEADRIAIGFLEPDNLKDQICFRSERALECLQFAGAEGITI